MFSFLSNSKFFMHFGPLCISIDLCSLSDMILDLLIVKHSVGLSASMACQRCLILSSCSSRKKVGGLKLEDLPGLEALQLPGPFLYSIIVAIFPVCSYLCPSQENFKLFYHSSVV